MPEPISPVLIGLESREVVYAKDQPEYLPLPVLRKADGTLLMRLKFTDDERDEILRGYDLFVEVLTFNHPLQPMRFIVGDRELHSEELGEGYRGEQ